MLTLKRKGFRKSGFTWNRISDGVAHVVDFQISSYSHEGEVTSFTINIGIALERVWQIYYGHGLTSKIKETDCFPNFRIGEVISGFSQQSRDVWWDLIDNDIPSETLVEVKSALVDHCLPLLDRLQTSDAVFHFIQKEAPLRYPYPYLKINWAIICYLHGEVGKAESQLIELYSDPKLSDAWKIRIDEVRSRFGLL